MDERRVTMGERRAMSRDQHQLRYATDENPEIVPTEAGCMIIVRTHRLAALVLHVGISGPIALLCFILAFVPAGTHSVFGQALTVDSPNRLARVILFAVGVVIVLQAVVTVRQSLGRLVIEIRGATLTRIQPGLWGLRVKQWDLSRFGRAECEFGDSDDAGKYVVLHPRGEDARDRAGRVFLVSDTPYGRPVLARIAPIIDDAIRRLNGVPLRTHNSDE